MTSDGSSQSIVASDTKAISTSSKKTKRVLPKLILKSPNEAIVACQQLFYLANPAINFGNPFDRKALDTLIYRFGVQNVLEAIKYALSDEYTECKYNPIIDTPRRLLDNWLKLCVFAKRSKVGGGAGMKIGGDAMNI
jgi:hypothetical protein